jgi:hypothetical protein
LSQEAALHAWNLIDLGEDISQIFRSIVNLVRDDNGNLEVEEFEDGGGNVDGSLGRIGDRVTEELAGEEGAETRSIHAGAHDKLVSGRGIVDDASLESVLGTTEVLVGNVVVVSLSGEVISQNFSDHIGIIESKAVKGIVLLESKEVSKGEQIVRESVEVMEAHLGQRGHVLRIRSGGRKLGAPTETELGLGNTEDGGGNDSYNGCKLSHLNLLFN